MTFGQADLTPLLQPSPTAQMRYASGVIEAWNVDTFENIIEVRGAKWVNLPVLAGADALTYKKGDVVGLIGADQQGTRGIASYAIVGRFVVPGPGKGEAAVEWMTSELGRAVSAAVFADRIASDDLTFQISNPVENTWQDGEFAGTVNPGPAVEMEITTRGAALVIVKAAISSQDGGEGEMGFEISGETSKAPAVTRTASVRSFGAAPDAVNVASTCVAHITDLNPGVHKFEAKYKSLYGLNGSKPAFAYRLLTVIGF